MSERKVNLHGTLCYSILDYQEPKNVTRGTCPLRWKSISITPPPWTTRDLTISRSPAPPPGREREGEGEGEGGGGNDKT